MSPAPVACEAKARLLRAYEFAVFDYNRALTFLDRHSGISFKRESEELQASAEKARQLAEQARAALATHTIEHEC
jgi:hypothetical protein